MIMTAFEIIKCYVWCWYVGEVAHTAMPSPERWKAYVSDNPLSSLPSCVVPALGRCFDQR